MTGTTQELMAQLSGFTPGPWRTRPARIGGDIAVVTENGDIIGEVFEDIRHARENAMDECRENAALIAAAPDLHRIVTEQAAEIERLQRALLASQMAQAEAEALEEQHGAVVERLRTERDEAVTADKTSHGLMRLAMKKRAEVIVRCDVQFAEIERLREALKFYANPEIYKPHPHGIGFDNRDASFVAHSALAVKP